MFLAELLVAFEAKMFPNRIRDAKSGNATRFIFQALIAPFGLTRLSLYANRARGPNATFGEASVHSNKKPSCEEHSV